MNKNKKLTKLTKYKQENKEIKEMKDKLDTIDKIIELYPELKKNKVHIISSILGNNKKPLENMEKIVVQFEYNNTQYYKSNLGEIFDNNVELVGVWNKMNNGEIKYLFFNENNIDDEIDFDFTIKK